jgi:hypothetical protein
MLDSRLSESNKATTGGPSAAPDKPQPTTIPTMAASGLPTAPWAMTTEAVCKHFGVDREKGLSSDQVNRLRETYGPNELPEEEGSPPAPPPLAQARL